MSSVLNSAREEYRDIVQACKDGVRTAKAHLQFNLAKDAKGTRRVPMNVSAAKARRMRACCWTVPQKRLKYLKPPSPQPLLVTFAFRNLRQGRPIARLFPLIPRVAEQETIVTGWNTGSSTETSFHIGMIEHWRRFPQDMQNNSWSPWSSWLHYEQGIGVNKRLCWGAFLPHCAVGLCVWDLMACAVLLEALGVGLKNQLWCKAWKKCDGHVAD